MFPTLAGLAAIPFIVHPIDNAVHSLLNTTLRPYMRNVICDGARGRDVGLDMCQLSLSDDDGNPGTLLDRVHDTRSGRLQLFSGTWYLSDSVAMAD
jgi:hypothetical protein